MPLKINLYLVYPENAIYRYVDYFSQDTLVNINYIFFKIVIFAFLQV